MFNSAPEALTILNQTGNVLHPSGIGYTKVYIAHSAIVHADITQKVFWNKQGGLEVKSTLAYTGGTNEVITGLTQGTTYTVRGAFADEMLDTSLIDLKDQVGQDWIVLGNTVSYTTATPPTITNMVVSAEKVSVGAAPPIVTATLAGMSNELVIQSSPDNGAGQPTGTWTTEYAGIFNTNIKLGIPDQGYGTYHYRVGASSLELPDGTIDTISTSAVYGSPVTVALVTTPPVAPTTMTHKAYKITDKDVRYDLLTSWVWAQGTGGALRQFLVETIEAADFAANPSLANWADSSKYTAGESSIILANFPYGKPMFIRVSASAWGNTQSAYLYDKVFLTASGNDTYPVTPSGLIAVDGTIPANSSVQVDYYGITAKNNNKETFRLDARNGDINIGSAKDYNNNGIHVAPIRFNGTTGDAHIDGSVIANELTSSSFVMAWLTNAPGQGKQPAMRTSNVPNYSTPSPNGGLWMGYDGAGTSGFKMHMGSTTQYIKWDGTKMILSGQLIVKNAAGVEEVLENITGAAGVAGPAGNYTDYIYKVQPTNPGVPANAYDPMPSTWFAVPPVYSPGEVVWVSEGTRNGIGEVITGWSMPTKWNGDPGGPTGNYYEYRFQRAITPVGPTRTDPAPAGWSTQPPATGEALWFIIGLKVSSGLFATGEQWSLPAPHDGASMLVQYSPTTVEAAFHNPPFVSGDVYMRQKLTTSATWSAPMRIIGEGAKNLSLSSDAQVFNYDKDGIILAGQSLVFTAARQNIDVTNLDWTAWDQDGNRLNLIMDGTNDLLRTITGTKFAAANITSVRVLVKGDGLEDQITIIKLKQGTDGITPISGLLTNESHNAASDEDGNLISGFGGVGGDFYVYEGLTRVTSGVVYAVHATSSPAPTTSIVGGVYAITGMPTTSRTAWVDYSATYKGVVVIKRFSFSKTYAGRNSLVFTLSANTQTLKYNSGGILTPTGQVVNFTTKKNNISGTVTWTSVPAGVNTTGDNFTLTATQFAALGGTSATIIATCAGLSDRTTISKLTDGDTTVSGYLTNESHTVPTLPDGSGGGWTNTNGNFILYEGASLIATNRITFSRVSFTVGMTTDIDAAGRYTASLSNTADAGTAMFRAIFTDSVGRTITLDKSFTVSKAKGGEAGLNAKTGILSTSRQVFTFDKATNAATPTNQVATLNFSTQNVSGTSSWSAVNQIGTNVSSILVGSGDSRTISVASFTHEQVTITATKGGYSDSVTLIKVVDGESTLNAILSNENFAYPVDSLGIGAIPASAGGDMLVYDGSTRVTPTYSIGTKTAGLGITINSSGQYTVTSLMEQGGFADITAVYKGASLVKRYTISKTYQGADGISAVLSRPSYVVNTDVNGNGGSYAGGSGSFEFFVADAKPAGVVYSVVSGTTTGLTGVAINSSSGIYSITGLTVDIGSTTFRATYLGKTYDRIFTVTKAKAGSNGSNGTPGTNGSNGAPGAPGSDAILVRLVSTAQAFTYNSVGNPDPATQTIQFTAVLVNTGTAPTWSVTNQVGSAVSYTIVSTTVISVNQAQFGANTLLKVVASSSGQADTITVVKLRDGSNGANGAAGSNGTNGSNGAAGTNGSNGVDAVVAYLTNESHTVPSDYLGNVSSYSGAGGDFKVYKGLSDITGSCTFALHSASGATGSINSSGGYSISNFSSTSTVVGTLVFRAIYAGVTHYKTFTITKSMGGVPGANGVNGVNGTPGTNGTNGSNGAAGTNGSNGTNGAAGDNGSGFYTYSAATYPAWDNGNAYARFVSVVGRAPKAQDVFTQVHSGVSEGISKSSTRIYNGSSWPAASAHITGDIIVTGSLAVDKLIANTAFVNNIGTSYIVDKNSFTGSLTPPAAYNMLIDLQNGFIHIK